MTSDEFKKIVTEHKVYLKPALFTILIENAEVFSDETKQEIVDQLKEADAQMEGLYEYQTKRNGIMEKWIGKFDDFYKDLKAKFNEAAKNEMMTDKSEADQLLSNL